MLRLPVLPLPVRRLPWPVRVRPDQAGLLASPELLDRSELPEQRVQPELPERKEREELKADAEREVRKDRRA